jgi:hypothetical protein
MTYFRCPKDDSGDCCGKCNQIIAVMPVNGRLPLVRFTIERLLKRNGVGRVICIGGIEEKATCEKAGAEFIIHANKPLGAKWNAGFLKAKEYRPAGCLFVGSSDWLSDNWIPALAPLLDDYDMVGTPGCHFLDISKNGQYTNHYKVCQWMGYSTDRKGESIGIGRLLSARVLDRIGWKPFADTADASMDHWMVTKVNKAGGKALTIDNKQVISLSISTDRWINKHRFKDHEKGALKNESIMINQSRVKGWLETNFPEATKIFLGVKS